MTKNEAIVKIESHILLLSEYGIVDLDIADTLISNIVKIIDGIDTNISKEQYTEISRYWEILKKLKDSEEE
jgi:hypothetical protein